MSADLDLTPHPGATPLAARVRAQAGMEATLMMRNGEQLVLALIIPVIVLVGGSYAADRIGWPRGSATQAIDLLTPGVLALAVMSTAFTSLAVATGFERRYAVIKRLGATPLGREGLLLGKTAALVIVQLVQFAVITGVGLALGWRPSVSLLGVLATVIMGTAAFATWGLFLAGTLRAEATLAAANLIYLLLLAGGAVVLPATTYGGLGSLVQWLPSGALGESMRAALVDGSIDFTRLAVLAAWALAGGVLTARSFRWE